MVSPGIALGKAFVYPEEKLSIPTYDISAGQVEFEFERFQNALEMAQQELAQLKETRGGEISETESNLIHAHLLMTRDPELSELVKKELAIRLKNVEWVLLKAVEEMVEQLNASGDAYLQERSTDIHDVSRRIMGHLLYKHKIPLTVLDEDCILIAHNLLPSDVISMDKQKVIGIATDVGGKTSHTAILTRSFEIPAVLGLSDLTRFVNSGDEIIVDGNEGLVILKPDEATRKKYQFSREAWLRRELQLLTLNELPAETRDGKLLLLEANIEIPEEVDSVLAHGADGIGLYRSEFLYILPHRFPLEDEQVVAYRTVLESMNPRSVTIRTLDLGGDKLIPSVKSIEESNPILGWRAVRFCIARPDIFKTQLRALLRASVYGNLKIMFPMISGIEELNLVLDLFEDAKEELKKKGVPFKEDIPIGIMIEVPSAALTSDILAKKVDFFSIGTNDLIQYTIAVDRENERIAYLYEPFHPGVLRMIKLVIDNAHNQGISVGMCGEMAGDANAAIILLGLGLDEFSMSAIGIPEIKKIIRSVTIAEAEEAAGNIMEMKSYQEIDKYMHTWMEEKFDFISR
jgi:phosphotransferase system enzyme I (PtsI)